MSFISVRQSKVPVQGSKGSPKVFADHGAASRRVKVDRVLFDPRQIKVSLSDANRDAIGIAKVKGTLRPSLQTDGRQSVKPLPERNLPEGGTTSVGIQRLSAADDSQGSISVLDLIQRLRLAAKAAKGESKKALVERIDEAECLVNRRMAWEVCEPVFTTASNYDHQRRIYKSRYAHYNAERKIVDASKLAQSAESTMLTDNR